MDVYLGLSFFWVITDSTLVRMRNIQYKMPEESRSVDSMLEWLTMQSAHIQ
jgi:hypothetical protein